MYFCWKGLALRCQLPQSSGNQFYLKRKRPTSGTSIEHFFCNFSGHSFVMITNSTLVKEIIGEIDKRKFCLWIVLKAHLTGEPWRWPPASASCCSWSWSSSCWLAAAGRSCTTRRWKTWTWPPGGRSTLLYVPELHLHLGDFRMLDGHLMTNGEANCTHLAPFHSKDTTETWPLTWKTLSFGSVPRMSLACYYMIVSHTHADTCSVNTSLKDISSWTI